MNADNTEPVGVIGLGDIGLPIALKLLAAGFTVYGCARRPPSPRFSQAGGRACRNPAEVVANSSVVLTLLPSQEALADVATGPQGLVSSGRRDLVWVEMSTIDEEHKQRAARTLSRLEWRVLDCPVSGAPPQLHANTATLFGSGDAEAYKQVEPVLRAISPNVHYLGEFGRGMRAKYTAYILLAGHIMVAAEALAFADRAGIPLGDVLTMLSNTINSSAVFEQRAPLVLEPGTATGRSRALGQALAGVRRLATDIGAETPVLSEALRHIDQLPSDAPDELVVALYRKLTASPRRVHQSDLLPGHPTDDPPVHRMAGQTR